MSIQLLYGTILPEKYVSLLSKEKRMDRLEESVKKLKQTSPSLERGRNKMAEFGFFFCGIERGSKIFFFRDC